MRVELRDKDNQRIFLDIKFWKTPVNERRKVNGKELINTYCQVCRIPSNSFTVVLGLPIVIVRAIQNPLDIYNRIVGKKVALAKAIATLDFLRPLDLFPHAQRHENKIRREMRKHVWEVFHQTFGRWN